MKIGFIENELILTSSGACNLAKEWKDLLSHSHKTEWISFKGNSTKVSSDYRNEKFIELFEDETKLEDYDILIVNMLGEPSQKFYDALRNSKRAVTIFVYHDRTVIRDIYTEPSIMAYINACDYTMTYQPKFLQEKMRVPVDKLIEISPIMFYKSPKDYPSNIIPINERKIDQLFCNRTNNFKGSRLFMNWCTYLSNKGIEEHRVMKGFHPDYPHKDLSNHNTKSYRDDYRKDKPSTDAAFFTENYGDHTRCIELLQNSKFVWLAQDYSNYPEQFKDEQDYTSYLNFDLDGTALEALFCGCIPILHINNKDSMLIQELKNNILFYDPEKGYDDLYEQYIKMNGIKAEQAQENLASVRDLFECSKIFENGLLMSIIPQSAFDYTKALAKQLVR